MKQKIKSFLELSVLCFLYFLSLLGMIILFDELILSRFPVIEIHLKISTKS